MAPRPLGFDDELFEGCKTMRSLTVIAIDLIGNELPARRRQRGHEKLEHQDGDRCHQLLFP